MASNLATFISYRCITTSSIYYGKRNFRKFLLYEKRGTPHFKKNMELGKYPDLADLWDRGQRQVLTEKINGKDVPIPETIPQLVVPDLEGFKLKPYVSYRVEDINEEPMTPQDLFHAVYIPKILEDFKNGNLNEDGNSLEPSENEKMSADEAKNIDKATGSDVYGGEDFNRIDCPLPITTGYDYSDEDIYNANYRKTVEALFGTEEDIAAEDNIEETGS